MSSSSIDEDIFPFDDDEGAINEERRGMGGGMKALVASLAIVLVLAGGAFGGFLYIQYRISSNFERVPDVFETLTDRPAHPEPTDDTGTPINFLVLGTDSRISAGDPSQWEFGAQRTDAIMVVHVSGDRESAIVMSIPRDSWVPIADHGDHKINAAFSFGGPSLMVQTVEDISGIPIDHFLVSDFESFSTLTDELGGVDIHLRDGLTGTTANGTHVDLPPGVHRLDGDSALMYAQDRFNVPGGDFGRVQRHQGWMRAMMAAAIRENSLTNPTRALDLAETVASTLAVDEDLSVLDLAGLAWSMRDLRPNDITFITAPTSGTGWSPDGRQSIVNLDWDDFEALSDAIAEDRVMEFLEENPGIAEQLGHEVAQVNDADEGKYTSVQALGIAAFGALAAAVYRTNMDHYGLTEIPAAALETVAATFGFADTLPEAEASSLTQLASEAFTQSMTTVATTSAIVLTLAAIAAGAALRRVPRTDSAQDIS